MDPDYLGNYPWLMARRRLSGWLENVWLVVGMLVVGWYGVRRSLFVC